VRWPDLGLEYVQGETLRSHLKDRRTVPVDEVVRIGREVRLASVAVPVGQQDSPLERRPIDLRQPVLCFTALTYPR